MEGEQYGESMSLMVDYEEIMELLGMPSEPLTPVENSVGTMTQDQVNNNTMSTDKDDDQEIADHEPLYEDIISEEEVYEEEQGYAAAEEPNNVGKSCQHCGITPAINALFLLPKINDNSDVKTLQENMKALITCLSYQQGQINNIQKKLDTINNNKDHNCLS